MRVHFIAVGGSVMHNLAIALKEQGHQVTGSDDEVFEPSKSRLEKHGLLVEAGWKPESITPDINAVILGMHAKDDNPELQKAKSLGLKIYSYPEYIFQLTKNKQRVVVAGSHGKTTVTSMIIHVLNYWNKKVDYLVGASLPNIDSPVKLTDDAPAMILEGDEYMSSALDKRPKFLNYHQHIGVITGIAWDHVNVYPNYDDYVHQFQLFAENTPKAGSLIYCEDDKVLKKLIKKSNISSDVTLNPYTKAKSKVKDDVTYLTGGSENTAIKVFGDHNLQNISAAMLVCQKMNISTDEFIEAIATFEGAAFRMQLLKKGSNGNVVYRDFAHAPSKVLATVKGFAKKYNKQKNVACLELHTYSSLNKNFIQEYENTLKDIEEAVVYFNPDAIRNKGLQPITEEEVSNAFKHKNLKVFTNSDNLKKHLTDKSMKGKNFLLMTSANFNGMDLEEVANLLAE